MKFDVEHPEVDLDCNEPVVGDLYLVQGGRKNGRAFHVIAAKSHNGEYCHALILDISGEIIGTTSYGTHVFRARDKIGRAELPEMIQVSWVGNRGAP